MPTPLHKPIVREVILPGKFAPVTMVVELLPGGLITFREKGKRRRVEIGLGHCHVLAEIIEAQHQHKEKLTEYKLKKKAGFKRLRRPRKPNLFFSKFYNRAFK